MFVQFWTNRGDLESIAFRLTGFQWKFYRSACCTKGINIYTGERRYAATSDVWSLRGVHFCPPCGKLKLVVASLVDGIVSRSFFGNELFKRSTVLYPRLRKYLPKRQVGSVGYRWMKHRSDLIWKRKMAIGLYLSHPNDTLFSTTIPETAVVFGIALKSSQRRFCFGAGNSKFPSASLESLERKTTISQNIVRRRRWISWPENGENLTTATSLYLLSTILTRWIPKVLSLSLSLSSCKSPFVLIWVKHVSLRRKRWYGTENSVFYV